MVHMGQHGTETILDCRARRSNHCLLVVGKSTTCGYRFFFSQHMHITKSYKRVVDHAGRPVRLPQLGPRIAFHSPAALLLSENFTLHLVCEPSMNPQQDSPLLVTTANALRATVNASPRASAGLDPYTGFVCTRAAMGLSYSGIFTTLQLTYLTGCEQILVLSLLCKRPYYRLHVCRSPMPSQWASLFRQRHFFHTQT